MDSPSSIFSSCAKRGLQPYGSQSSFSSSSSSSSSSSFRSNSFPFIHNQHDLPPLSPLPHFQLSKVPFSWEQHPGIPKKYSKHLSDSDNSCSAAMLPLPPSAGAGGGHSTGKKNNMHGSSERDPFAVALVECSKKVNAHHQNEVEKYWKVSRVVSDRFSFMDRYASCKKSCAVAESVVLLPRPIRNATRPPF